MSRGSVSSCGLFFQAVELRSPEGDCHSACQAQAVVREKCIKISCVHRCAGICMSPFQVVASMVMFHDAPEACKQKSVIPFIFCRTNP